MIIENPQNSLMWETSHIKRALSSPGWKNVDWQMCMYGSKRDKKTRLMTNTTELGQMSSYVTAHINTSHGELHKAQEDGDSLHQKSAHTQSNSERP